MAAIVLPFAAYCSSAAAVGELYLTVARAAVVAAMFVAD